jgi:hypothetical protein
VLLNAKKRDQLLEAALFFVVSSAKSGRLKARIA